ncbi:hypothetical protein ACFY7V_33920 [[Kitasatospora] papulosa]|uniref:hypothetical protein n=1 Tax=Streptomyces TaxID=1883 RepID=UPI002FF20895
MTAPPPAVPAPQRPGLQPPDFGRSSLALLERATRGHARFPAQALDATTGDHAQDVLGTR